MARGNPFGRIVNFMPGEIVIAVRHAGGNLSPFDIVQGLVTETAPEPLREDEELQAALRRLSRVATLSPSLSLVIIRLSGDDAEDDRILARINHINAQLVPHDGPGVVGLTANWLTSGCSTNGMGGGGVGGPGGQPVAPASLPKGKEGYFQLPKGIVSTGGGKGAHVAVIDTLPSEMDLRHALATWRSNKLLSDVLGNDRFQTHSAGGMHLLQTVGYSLLSHPYAMPDHGLFVSGIIRAIAPQAEIHLIEALNPFGVGSFESFANAFLLVHKLASGAVVERGERVQSSVVVSLDNTALHRDFPANKPVFPLDGVTVPYVVNCSFMFNAPTIIPGGPQRSTQHPSATEAAGQVIERIWSVLDPLFPKGTVNRLFMFAAAGNDGVSEGLKTGHFRPARYPAAFTTVTGVGALDRDDTPAVYTDLSDLPPSVGFATFGGNVIDDGSPGPGERYLTDSKKGMLGIYSCPRYPDGTPNVTGWARWAGTSFATPILSGVTALRLSAPQNTTGVAPDPLGNIQTVSTAISPIGPIFDATQN